MYNTPALVLSNGRKMPMIGLGTWRTPPEATVQTIKDAIDIGYRHIDCAPIYGNEPEVGIAIEEKISEGCIKRSDIFITSKLWNTFHNPDMVREACLTTLKNLRISYLDNYLMHWPTGFKDGADMRPTNSQGKIIFSKHDYIDTWKAMEELVAEGLCRGIGVSNFNQHQLQRLISNSRYPPVNLQIELHPYLTQKPLIQFCAQHHIAITSYSSLGSPHSPYQKPGEFPIMKHPKVIEIAKKYSVSPAEVLLRYHVQQNRAVIPRSVNKVHMADNLSICNFIMTNTELENLDSLNIDGRFMTWTIASGHPYHPFEHKITFDDKLNVDVAKDVKDVTEEKVEEQSGPQDEEQDPTSITTASIKTATISKTADAE